jgi:hypothetical protein
VRRITGGIGTKGRQALAFAGRWQSYSGAYIPKYDCGRIGLPATILFFFD